MPIESALKKVLFTKRLCFFAAPITHHHNPFQFKRTKKLLTLMEQKFLLSERLSASTPINRVNPFYSGVRLFACETLLAQIR